MKQKKFKAIVEGHSSSFWDYVADEKLTRLSRKRLMAMFSNWMNRSEYVQQNFPKGKRNG